MARRRGRATAPSRLHIATRLVVTTALACLLPASTSLAEDAAPVPRVLRVATSGDYAPFSSAAPSSTETTPSDLQGFDIEVATRFAHAHGYTLEFVRFRWPDLSRELAAAGFDVAMSGVTMRPERSIAGRFSVPVAATHAMALTWKGSGAATFQDLDKPTRRIAVNAGGHLEKVTRQVFRRADIVALSDNDAVRMAMLDRAYDAVVTDNYEAKVWTASASDVVRITPLSDDRKAYLLPADRVGLAAELDRWLLAREKDGTLETLRVRYFTGDSGSVQDDAADKTPAKTAMPIAALSAAVVERLALMPMVYEAKKRAGKAIEDKDQEAIILDSAQRSVEAEAAARLGAGGTNANPATVAPPDAAAVRSLFEALIVIGKDAQQKLADLDAKRRPGSVQARSAVQAKDSGPSAAAREPAEERSAAPRRPVYDLATELRPAIGRITARIACILVAMDAPIPLTEARRALGNALAPHDVRSEQIDAMASAVARISSRPPAK